MEETPDPESAISRALDLSGPAPQPLQLEPPAGQEEATDPAAMAEPIRWWLQTMVSSPRLLEERLTWFWHDHFATALRKVRIPYLLWAQHLTIRRLATTSLRELLHAVATDPAMLLYLDGISNVAGRVNENYAREVMELHTMGGGYTQRDVAEAARAFTGWVVYIPYVERARAALAGRVEPWSAVFVPQRHDHDTKELLGRRGTLDLPAALEVLLELPATARNVASKLFTELVGFPPDPATGDQLGTLFHRQYSVMELVEAVVSHPSFLSDEAVRSKVRTPVERLVAIAQGFGGGNGIPSEAVLALHRVAYLPFNPPSPAGFPRGELLWGPYQLVHAFDLVAVAERTSQLSPSGLLTRLGVHDACDETLRVLEQAPASLRVPLAANSPEFALV